MLARLPLPEPQRRVRGMAAEEGERVEGGNLDILELRVLVGEAVISPRMGHREALRS